MRLIQPFRPFSAANFTKPRSVHFNGNLIDEVDEEDRKKMDKIDSIASSKPMSGQLRRDYDEYLQQYDDLNGDFQFGVQKEGLIGILKRRVTEMWNKLPEEYKKPPKEHSVGDKPQTIKPKPPLGSRGSSKLSQIVESAAPGQE